MFAPRLINKWFDLKNDEPKTTNGATVTESFGDDDKLKKDALDASAFSINDLLIPAGIAAVVLLYAK